MAANGDAALARSGDSLLDQGRYCCIKGTHLLQPCLWSPLRSQQFSFCWLDVA